MSDMKLPPRPPGPPEPPPVREMSALERAGRAICRLSGLWPDARVKSMIGGVEAECFAWQMFAAQFAVGLLAIREPTAAVLAAGRRDIEEIIVDEAIVDLWQAMVDEVLK